MSDPRDTFPVHMAVIDRLATVHGIRATLEYPGYVAIRLDGTHDVWVADEWDWGTRNVLEDGTMVPDEGDDAMSVNLIPGDLIGADVATMAAEIADAWAACVTEWRVTRENV